MMYPFKELKPPYYCNRCGNKYMPPYRDIYKQLRSIYCPKCVTDINNDKELLNKYCLVNMKYWIEKIEERAEKYKDK